MSYIRNNIIEIKRSIESTCKGVGRDPEEIKIIGVTKTVDLPKIKEAIGYGLRSIGENKVQEIREKHEKIDESIEWHMIGHLQTNKVKYIIDKVDLIQSLDSIRLAKEINKQCKKNNGKMNVLIQVNIANADSKFGISPKEIHVFLDKLSEMNNLKIKGLMTIVPYVENPEKVRVYFKKMKELFDSLKNRNGNNIQLEYLSMGMTNDYLIAIEEGSNMVRIGTGVFGQRNYN